MAVWDGILGHNWLGHANDFTCRILDDDNGDDGNDVVII